MRISILIEALTGKFETDTARASKRFSRDMQRMQKDAARLGRQVGFAMTAAAGAFAFATRQVVASAARLDDVSQFTNVAVESLQELLHAGEMVGIEARGMEDSLRRLTRRAGEFANSGGGPAQKAFEALGISVRDASGAMKGTEQLFDEVVRGLQNVGSDAEIAAFAAQLFGDDYGPKLVPLLRQGEEGIARLRQEARSLGIVMSGESVAAAAEFSDTMDRLGKLARGFQIQLVAEMLPALQLVSERFFAAATEGDGFGDAAAQSADRVVRSLAFVMDAAEGVRRTFQVFGRAIAINFAVLELAVVSFADAIYNGPNKAFDALIRQANRLPGVNLPEVGLLPGGESIQRRMDLLKGIVREGMGDIHGILTEPMPGESFLNELERRAETVLPNIVRSIQNSVTELAATANQATDSVAKMIAALEQQAATLGFTDTAVQLYRIQLEGATDEQLRHAEALLESIDSHDALQGAMQDASQVFDATRTPLERFNAEIERLNMLRDTFVNGSPLIDSETYRRAVESAQESLQEATQTTNEWANMMDEAARSAASNIQSALADFLFDPFEGGLSGMLQSFSDTLRRMAAEVVANQILQSLFQGSGGLGGAIGGMFGFGGSRDSGGRGLPGMAYAIGTGAQPEMFIPDTAGTFVPAGMMGGAQIYNTITVQAPQGRISRESDLQLRSSLASATSEGMRRGR